MSVNEAVVAGLRTLVFVDAGYLRAMAADLLEAEPADVALNGQRLNFWAAGRSKSRLLRVYVYDGAWPHDHRRALEQQAEHDLLADTEGIRLRLGTLRERPGKSGGFQQKGVDTLLVLDMLQMAQTNSYDLALLVAGDADFVEVVDAVQRLGRNVYVACRESRRGLAVTLQRVADGLVTIKDDQLKDLVSLRVRGGPQSVLNESSEGRETTGSDEN